MVSEGLALASAFCIALSSVMAAGLKGRVPLLQLARWQLGAAFAAMLAISALTGGWWLLTADQVRLLVASGVVGIGVASLTYYAALYMVGARVTSLMFTLAAPFSLALGYIVLGETVSLRQGAGILLVLAGIVLAIGLPEARPAADLRTFRLGVLAALVTALGQSVGSLLARPAMAAGVEPFTAMAVRAAPALAIFWLLALLPAGRAVATVRSRAFGVATLSALIGTGLGMVLMMAALHRGSVGIVTTLSSVTPILVLPLGWAVTGERPTAAAWIGACVAVAGIALIGM